MTQIYLYHRYSNHTYNINYEGPLELVAQIAQELGLTTAWYGFYNGEPPWLLISPRFDRATPEGALGCGTYDGLVQELTVPSWDEDSESLEPAELYLNIRRTGDDDDDDSWQRELDESIDVEPDNEAAIRQALIAKFLWEEDEEE